MNVLIFTMVLVFMMAILSYTRLETYRNYAGLQQLFKHYMEVGERDGVNKLQQKRYENQKKIKPGLPVKEMSDKDKAETAPLAGSRVSLFYLVRPEERDKSAANQDIHEQQLYLTKKLLIQLYHDQPFYKDAETHVGPQFLDALLQAVGEAAKSLPKDQKIVRTDRLSNLELSNPYLNNAFYKMLKGAPEMISFGLPTGEADPSRPLDPMEPIFASDGEESKVINEDDVEDDNRLENDEPQARKGYKSILPSISVRKGHAIRIWLASPDLLKAIYGESAETVKTVRQNYYRQLMRNETTVDEIKRNLKAQFDSSRDPALKEEFLDYSASKTNPLRNEP